MIRFFLLISMAVIAGCGPKPQAINTNELKVMTYNIHHANPPSKPNVIDIDAIAAAINKEKPGIVALQEVDVNTGRSGINEAVILAEKTKMNFYFAKAIDFDGGQYGVAILSRYSISNGSTHKLPTLEGTNGEPRVLATANITVNGKQITIACTHLDAQRSDTNRILQINKIAEILNNERNPVILAGDMNSSPGGAVISTLDQFFTRTCTQNCALTFPQVNPDQEIDFVAYKPATAFEVQEHRVADEKYASDHLPVVVTLRIN